MRSNVARLRPARRIHGIDFSGSRTAGRTIWVSTGRVTPDGLLLEGVCRAESLPGWARERDRCLAGLRSFLGTAGEAVIGLDFPFGLPQALMGDSAWEPFLLGLADRHRTAEAFQAECREAAGARELRRLTDRQAASPFSPYNLRMYRQTYYGMVQVLAPLVAAGAVCVLPMQPAEPDKPWLLEICPASTLKQLGVYAPYKGRHAAHRAQRAAILNSLEKHSGLQVTDERLRSVLIGDAGGDALDSAIAAIAVFRALQDLQPESDPRYLVEGRIYA